MSSGIFTRTRRPGRCSASTVTRCAGGVPTSAPDARGISHSAHTTYAQLSNDGWSARAQELLTALLMKPVADLDAAEATNDSQSTVMCDITVADILGPLLKAQAGTSAEVADGTDRARDTNLSLLSYSFSLVGPGSNLKQRVADHGHAERLCKVVQYRVRVWRGAGRRSGARRAQRGCDALAG